MIPLDTWLVFVVACVALAVTPGPSLLYIVSRTLVQGRPAGFMSLAGTITGLLFHVLAAAFGLSALLLAVPMAYDVVRMAGACYLAWLAWQTWRAPPPDVGGDVTAPQPYFTLWRDGAATGILNPKVALFQLALVPAIRRSRARQRARAEPGARRDAARRPRGERQRLGPRGFAGSTR